LCLDLSEILSVFNPLASRLEDEYGRSVDQGCNLYKVKLKFIGKTIRETVGRFPKVSKFDEPFKKMTYQEMLEKVTADAI
jgi:hypothetical protein